MGTATKNIVDWDGPSEHVDSVLDKAISEQISLINQRRQNNGD